MSPIKRALISGYVAQVFTALIGILMVPVYLRYLGAEAFGLIGFFTMMQAWLQLLDLGLTPALSRQMACYKGGTLQLSGLMELMRTLECLFGGAAAAVTVVGVLAAPWLAARWLRLEHLSASQVALCIGLMAAAAGLRWVSNIYRSGLIGLERQVLANGITSLMAGVKFLGVIPVLAFVSASPEAFFGYQAAAVVLEVVLCAVCLYRVLQGGLSASPSMKALREVLPFAGGLAFVTLVWIVVTNLDKLLLSHLLALKDYGYFSIGCSVAGVIPQLMMPVSQVVQPRLTILHTQGRKAEEAEVFREVSQFTTCVVAAVALNIAAFAEPLLLAWTGNAEVAAKAAPILLWYALGNGLIGVLTLLFLVQVAAGSLRLHVIGNLLFGSVQIPLMIYAAMKAGGEGTGMVWFFANLAFLFGWMPFVFRRFLHGLYLKWIVHDVGLPLFAAAVPVALLVSTYGPGQSRWAIVLQLAVAGTASVACAFVAGSRTRARLFAVLAGLGARSPERK